MKRKEFLRTSLLGAAALVAGPALAARIGSGQKCEKCAAGGTHGAHGAHGLAGHSHE